MRTISITSEARRFQELFTKLARDRPLRDPVAQMCEKLSLTGPQVHAILWLGHDGPLSMREVARRVGISVQTITGVVDRLERDGYVVRVRGEEDRRVVRVSLTRAGAAMYRRLDGLIQQNMAMGLGLLEPEERETLYRLVEKVMTRALALPAAPRPKTTSRRRDLDR